MSIKVEQPSKMPHLHSCTKYRHMAKGRVDEEQLKTLTALHVPRCINRLRDYRTMEEVGR